MSDSDSPIRSPRKNLATIDAGYAYFFTNTDLVGEPESGDSTPSLWRNSGIATPESCENGHRAMSPISRAQAIAKGQKELMDFVRRMPETCYELSLKDLVENPSTLDQEWPGARNPNFEDKSKKASDKRKAVNLDNRGLFLNLFFPVPFRPGKRKSRSARSKVESQPHADGRTSPVPLLGEGLSPEHNGGGGEWWMGGESDRSGFSSSGKTSSSKSSGSDSRSSSRNRNRSESEHAGHRGCLFFFPRRGRRGG